MSDTAVAEVSDTAITMFERLARDPNIDPAKLQQLMDLQERAMKRSAEEAFNAAFADMQGDIPVITQNGEIKVNNDVRSRFARLEDIDRIIKPILQKYGFALTHKVAYGDKLTVTTILLHRAGHREETIFVAPPDTSGSKNGIQAIASTISYGKRQNTKAILNVAEGGEDDDGTSGGAPVMLSTEQAEVIQEHAERCSKTMLASILKSYKVKTLAEIPSIEFNTIARKLNVTLRKGGFAEVALEGEPS